MKKKIDIIIPICNEEKNLNNFFEAICKQVDGLKNYQWGYIFINDGSKDGSLDILKKIVDNNKSAKIIDLTRNFGKELALTAGLDCTNADAAIFIDADLQHPPHLIHELIKKWENGSTIVTALRKSTKKQPIVRKVGSAIL